MNQRTNHKRAFWWRSALLVLAVLLNAALASRILWGSHSLYTWRVLKAKQTELIKELASLDEKRAALSREIRLLKTDPAYVEKIIRQRLNYVRKNEILYLFDKSSADSAWPEADSGNKHD